MEKVRHNLRGSFLLRAPQPVAETVLHSVELTINQREKEYAHDK